MMRLVMGVVVLEILRCMTISTGCAWGSGQFVKAEEIRELIANQDYRLLTMRLPKLMHENDIAELIPEVRALIGALNVAVAEERECWISAANFLLSRDKDLRSDEGEQILSRVRQFVAEPEVMSRAFGSLRRAYARGYDTRADMLGALLRKESPERLSSAEFQALLEDYGHTLTEDEVAELRRVWKSRLTEDSEESVMLALLDAGYLPTGQDMIEILRRRDPAALRLCLVFLQRDPSDSDTRRVVKELEASQMKESEYSVERCGCARVLFSWHGLESEEDTARRHAVVRECILRGVDEALGLEALLCGMNSGGVSSEDDYEVSIKDDLLLFARPGGPLKERKEEILSHLFGFYGEELSSREIKGLRRAWKDDPEMSEEIESLVSDLAEERREMQGSKSSGGSVETVETGGGDGGEGSTAESKGDVGVTPGGGGGTAAAPATGNGVRRVLFDAGTPVLVIATILAVWILLRKPRKGVRPEGTAG